MNQSSSAQIATKVYYRFIRIEPVMLHHNRANVRKSIARLSTFFDRLIITMPTIEGM